MDGLAEVLGEARDLGFLGPGPVDDHVDHARAFLVGLPEEGACVDLGSGGGVPGLVLATLLPRTRWTFVEAMVRRAAFLRAAVDRLGLQGRAEVREARAEEIPGDRREVAAAVTARGFGPPAVTAECAAGWLAVGGRLVVSEPPGGDPARWDAPVLARLGLHPPVVHPGPPAIAVLVKVAPTPAGYPRRVGLPAKRPLW